MIEPEAKDLNLKQRMSGHLRTITQHKLMVMQLCFKVGLRKQGLLHDLSKYSPIELKTGFRYYCGHRSPNALERDAQGHSEAWLHHKGRNKHHFEYWTDIIPAKQTESAALSDASPADTRFSPAAIAVPMPTRYVVEMFCDRVAACKVYQKENYTDGSALAYFRRESGKGKLMHPETHAFIESLLVRLSEEGEQATLRYIREEIVKPQAGYGTLGRY